MKNKHLSFFRLGLVRYLAGLCIGLLWCVFEYENYGAWSIALFTYWIIVAFLDILGELLDFIERSKKHKMKTDDREDMRDGQ